jgi:predicted permease
MSRSGPFRRLFRIRAEDPRKIEIDVRDEIAAHVRLAADHLIATGLPPAEAEAQARARFDNLDATLPRLYASAKRRESQIHAREWLGTLRRDLVFAVRQLRRAPVFAAGVVLCLGFGIGSSATVFSWMEGLVLRPLPAVPEIERLVTIRSDDAQRNQRSGSASQRALPISLPEFRDWSREAHSVSGLVARSLFMFGVEANPDLSDGRGEPFYGMFASANYFDVIGVHPTPGRGFSRDDDVSGNSPVVVISHQLWQSRFGASEHAIGKQILINGYPTTVIGVAPPGFGGTLAGVNFDLWVPLMSRAVLVPSESAPLESRDFRWLDVIGRLPPGGSVARSGAEFQAIARRLAAEHPESRDHTINVEPLDIGIAAQLRPLFSALIGLTVLVLIIVCSNVANLLLVRSAARSREIGVRLSLGASRLRIVGQLMTENILLAVLGAGLGTVAAYFGRGLLHRLLPVTSLPLVVNGRIDFTVLAFVMGVTCVAVMLFGLAPALRASRVNLADILKNGGRGSRASHGRTRSALVVAQFALSLTALVCGAVFLRRSNDLRLMDRGFKDPEHVVLVQTDMSFAGFRDRVEWQHEIDAVVDRLRGLPGARAASVATFVPLGFIGPRRSEIDVDGYAPKEGESVHVALNGVSPGYFDLMGIGVLQGRPITDDDRAGRPPVAVVNEAFVRQYLAGSMALGREVVLDKTRLRIVGIVKDNKFDYKRIDEPSAPLLYYAIRQSPSGLVLFHIRTTAEPSAMTGSIRDAIRAVAPTMPIVAPTTLAELASVPMFPSQLGVAVLGVLSGAALVLAAMGLYSVIAYGVALRTRELGIRLALGGTSRTVMMIFVRESLWLLGLGMLTGIGFAVLATWVLHAKVGFLQMPNAAAIVWPAAILSVVAMAAAFLPARRSASIDLAGTLRAE